MATRRSRHDPLATTDKVRWLVIRDAYGCVQDHRRLDPFTDLRGALILALAAYAADGWTMEDFSSTLAVSFCHRGADRRQITVEVLDPTVNHGYGQAKGYLDN